MNNAIKNLLKASASLLRQARLSSSSAAKLSSGHEAPIQGQRKTISLRESIELFRRSKFTVTEPVIPTPEMKKKLQERAEALKKATFDTVISPEEQESLGEALDRASKGRGSSAY